MDAAASEILQRNRPDCWLVKKAASLRNHIGPGIWPKRTWRTCNPCSTEQTYLHTSKKSHLYAPLPMLYGILSSFYTKLNPSSDWISDCWHWRSSSARATASEWLCCFWIRSLLLAACRSLCRIAWKHSVNFSCNCWSSQWSHAVYSWRSCARILEPPQNSSIVS